MTAVVDKVVDNAISVDNQKKIIGERIKQARSALKMTQKELVGESGIPLPSLRDYEGGKRMPGGDAVASLSEVGVNANWLLTGHGPMLWRDGLESAKQMRDNRNIDRVTEAQRKIVIHAKARIDKYWFLMSPSEPGHALNEIVDDYNQGRIFQGDPIRKEIPTVSIEDLIRWGRVLFREQEQEPKGSVGTEHRSSISVGYVAITRLESVQASAGPGAVIDGECETSDVLFKEEWIRYELRAKPQDLRLIRVSGDSMEPTLRSGDMVLVDMRASHPDREGIYILRMNGMVIVKRLNSKPGKVICVTSDNPLCSSFEVKLDQINDGEDFAVLGRVVWTGRLV